MNKRLIAIYSVFFLLIAFSGCTQNNLLLPTIIKTVTSTSSIVATPTANIPLYSHTTTVQSTELSKVPESNLYPTVQPTTSINLQVPTIETVIPEVIKLCPEEGEVALEDLEIDSDLQLIVAQLNESAREYSLNDNIFTISFADLTPKKIDLNSILDDDWNIYGYNLSPNNEWLELFYIRDDDLLKAIWISSLDSHQQWEVITTTFMKQIDWISDDEMIVLGIPNEEELTQGMPSNDDYFPLFSVNPFTGIQKFFSPLPKESIYDFYFSQGYDSFVVYFSGSRGSGSFEEFTLHNYTDNTSIPVFQWMTGKTWNDFAGVGRRKNGLFVAYVGQPYGFDLAIDLDLETILEPKLYNEIMKAIVLPGGEDVNLITGFNPGETTGAFVVRRFNYKTGEVMPIYIFDYHKMILKDYCIEDGQILFSPGERYISIMPFENTHTTNNLSNISGVVILDLETGHYARLEGYKVIGWGKYPVATSP